MTAHKFRSILPTMILMWLDHDDLLLNAIPRLVAGPTKSVLFPLILNPGITNEIMVLESIIHLNFKPKPNCRLYLYSIYSHYNLINTLF